MKRITLEEVHEAFKEIREKNKECIKESAENVKYSIDKDGNRVYDSMEDFLADNSDIVSVEEYLNGIPKQ